VEVEVGVAQEVGVVLVTCHLLLYYLVPVQTPLWLSLMLRLLVGRLLVQVLGLSPAQLRQVAAATLAGAVGPQTWPLQLLMLPLQQVGLFALAYGHWLMHQALLLLQLQAHQDSHFCLAQHQHLHLQPQLASL
jgi:hypothetical protein